MAPRPPPKDEADLLARAGALAGRTLGELANELELPVPPDLRRAKGFPGRVIEEMLGASAGSRAAPDFDALGIELKTLPVDGRGRPCESTFVCTIPLTEIGSVEWERSRVRRKLARVLWVPIEGDRRIPPGSRRVGSALLWSPSPEDEADLRFDWEDLSGRIGIGDLESITGHFGRYLQIRPKARDGRSRRRGVDEDGAPYAALPRGFYLRAQFTERLLAQNFVRPH